ncbi:MAG: UDP-N-acetylglucosamine 2-epimerase (non-hydrolyzing) [Bacteroidetes bacterium]|nr:UDP-N-acetylglucosamine 2-epimerase (non-hydrolyzing) [Bacteroidota bacterium]
MKVISIIGARPQFIKAAPLSHALKKQGIEELIIHTGQHYDPLMSQAFFDELSIPEPKYNLNISQLSHGAMTGRMLEAIETVLLKEEPEMVIVFGDTNSTLAGALAAKKIGIPIAHIESGMRSYLNFQPEEINRVLCDRISDLLFVSSSDARQNLINEGHSEEKIVFSGDIMYDLFKAHEDEASHSHLKGLTTPFALLTLHRQENVDDPYKLRQWLNALNDLAQHIPLLIPLHPRTKAKIEALDFDLHAQIIKPCSYLEMLGLLKACTLVVTDSGGLQKEAYFAKKACLTMRDATEWIELINVGANRLCSPDNLVAEFSKILEAKLEFPELFGDGHAAEIIAQKIQFFLEGN